MAIIISLIINNDILFGKDTDDSIVPAHNYYRYYLFCVLSFYFSDVLWGILYDNGLIQLSFIDTMVYFITMAGSVWLWTRYVVEYLEGNNSTGRMLKAIGLVFFIFVTLSQVVNCFSPVVFYYSENGDYKVGFVRN
ncbi:MAG: hypothetical protein IJH41_00440, partial [Eubacterium sp.]|nr:hypothetical protein [Eubacterium sp.]